MRIAFLLLCAACSSDPVVQAPGADASLPDSSSDSSSAQDTSTPEDASDAPTGPNTGLCASCTANMCLAQLQACGGSSSCTGNLVTFNDCLTAHMTSCGTKFAANGSAEAALWACLSTKCAATCGTN